MNFVFAIGHELPGKVGWATKQFHSCIPGGFGGLHIPQSGVYMSNDLLSGIVVFFRSTVQLGMSFVIKECK